jgi:Lipid A 3-O-deacylase (PagL)
MASCVSCPVRWFACVAWMLVLMAPPTRAQMPAPAPTGNALADVPDATCEPMGSASSGATASHASISSLTFGPAIGVDADGTQPMNVSGQQLSTGSVKFDFLTVPLLLPTSDDPARKLVDMSEITPAVAGKGRSNVQHRYPNDASESTQRQAFTHPAPDPDSKSPLSDKTLRHSKPDDFNRDIYYRNKLEFSLETGWLPINIPFVFDFLVGSAYTTWPLHYTMVPNIASIRWHVDGIGGPSILRGNTDFTFSGSYTAIPRGAETRYFAFDYGIRQNFVQPRWRIVPYFEARGGVGDINAKGPYGVPYAQGQDLTFTLMMGSGARYNFNPRYSIAAGMTYMHVSNAYLSQPRYEDLGINVYGPIVGVYMRIGRPKRRSGR